MRVPLSAMWPPMLLLALDGLVLVFTLYWKIWLLAVAALVGAAILVLDGIGRAVDFRHAARHLGQGRNPERVARTYQFSWCGRVACRAAAFSVSTKTGEAVAAYYAASGYRWFHIFPDNTFTRNSPFLTLRFWRITLGGNVHAQVRLAAQNDLPATQEAQEAQETRPVRKAA